MEHSFKSLTAEESSNEKDYLLTTDDGFGIFISLQNGLGFQYQDKEQVKTDAEYICKCVNNHEGLIDSLRFLQSWVLDEGITRDLLKDKIDMALQNTLS